jgi:hypothetical protein
MASSAKMPDADWRFCIAPFDKRGLTVEASRLATFTSGRTRAPSPVARRQKMRHAVPVVNGGLE